MITNTNPISMSRLMSQRTEGLGVSARGRAFIPTAAPAAAWRVRLVTGTEVKGHMGSAFVTTGDVAYLPGTRAWSPPLC